MEQLLQKMGRQYSGFILMLIAALTILPFLVISAFNHPTADDFCYTNFIEPLGFWEAQVEHYFIWTGRYTATALLTVNQIEWSDLTIYRIIPIFLLILFVLAIFVFVKKLLPNSSSRGHVILSFLIFFLYMYNIPTMSEAFYFKAASITYQLASNLSLLLFALILHIQQQKGTDRRGIFVFIASLLSILIIGLNETIMVILCGVLFVWTLGQFLLKKPNRTDLLVIFIFTVIAAILVVAAPGNLVRMSEKPERFQFIFSMVGSITSALIFILKWIPMTVLVIALFFPLLVRLSDYTRKEYNLYKLTLWQVFILAIFLLGFIVLCFFPSYWSQGGEPPLRTVNVIYLLYIIGVFFLTVFFLIYLGNTKAIPEIPLAVKISLSLIILCMVILKPNSFKEVYGDLINQTAYNYHLEMQQRYRLLKNCKKETCVIPALEHKPETLFSYDLTPDPSKDVYYYNQCIAEYFDIPLVLTPPKKETKPVSHP